MQNVLATFLFVLFNFLIQIAVHFIPVVGIWAFLGVYSPLHVMRLLAANASIGILLYDVFFDQGTVKYILYLGALGMLLLTGDDLAREKMFLVFILAWMFATMYFICYFWKTFETTTCLACSPFQLHENTPKDSWVNWQFSN